MKRLVIVLVLISSSIITYGQYYSRHNPNTYLDRGFEAKINIGYGFGIGDYKYDVIKFDVVSSYRFNSYFSTGIGTGVIFNVKNNGGYIPIFLNLQTNFSKSNVSPYLAGDIGFSIGRHVDGKIKNVGFYLHPSGGLNIKVSDAAAINIGLGYRTQYLRIRDYHTNYKDIKLNSLMLNIGVIF
jgi:long-subunit fatty acid transport protein